MARISEIKPIFQNYSQLCEQILLKKPGIHSVSLTAHLIGTFLFRIK